MPPSAARVAGAVQAGAVQAGAVQAVAVAVQTSQVSQAVDSAPAPDGDRDRIVRAAARSIGQDPDRVTTVADVLHLAGVNRRTFYRHFRSKDDLVLAMIEEAAAVLLSGLEAAVAAAPTASDAVRAYVGHMLGVGWQPPRAREGRAFLSREVRMTAAVPRALDEVYLRHAGVLREVLERGRADGSFPLADPGPDAIAAHAVLVRHLEARASGALDLPFAQVRDDVAGFFLRAFGAVRR